MLTRLGERVAASLTTADPWGTGYAVARTLITLGTLLTLIASPTESLFLPTLDRPEFPYCEDVARFGLFCAMRAHLDFARIMAIGILTLAATGFWPRILGLLQWWVTFSFQANATMVDGGDQIAAILLLLLLPCTLTDPRWNHWTRLSADQCPGPHAALWAAASLLAVRFQVAVIYFHACVGKLRTPEWIDGTVLYYWVFDPQFGASGLVRRFLGPLVMSPAVAWITWSVLAIELTLAIGLFLRGSARRALLWPGVLLHVGIALTHGLLSFSLVMIGGLVLYCGWNPALRGRVITKSGQEPARKSLLFARLLRTSGNRPSPVCSSLDAR